MARTSELDLEAITEPPPAQRGWHGAALLQHGRLFYVLAWIVIGCTLLLGARAIARAGSDIRWDFWTFWDSDHALGDLDNAMGNANAVLRDAQSVEEKDRAAGRYTALPTIAHPGPGLLDGPFDWHTLRERWKSNWPLYSQVYRGWVLHYERLQHDVRGGDFELDYPPLRLMVMTLWTWHVQSEFGPLGSFPSRAMVVHDPVTHQRRILSPEIVAPLLRFNECCDAVSAIAMGLLVWLWTNRVPRRPRLPGYLSRIPGLARFTSSRSARGTQHSASPPRWGGRWGDPLLLAPAVLLGVCLLLRPYVQWQFEPAFPTDSLLDQRVGDVGWWFFLLLKVVALVSLARLLPRPFRGAMCGLIAGATVFLNPAGILNSFGWPQWDCWMPPFFLLSALAVSLDCWLLGGIAIGVGCMFKGQLLFVSPVLLVAPLLAGWPVRFLRTAGGVGVGAAMVVWPWLIDSGKGLAYVGGVAFAALLVVIAAALLRRPLGVWCQRGWAWGRRRVGWDRDANDDVLADLLDREVLLPPNRDWLATVATAAFWTAAAAALVMAAWLVLMIWRRQDPSLHLYTLLLAAAVLTVPWLLRRRRRVSASITWIVLAATAAVWLAAFSLGGNFAWWTVGFLYGTQKHQMMQLSVNSLSNFSSILARRYRWDLHDPVGLLTVGGASANPSVLDVQGTLALVYGLALLVCTAASAMQLRRRDPRFLVVVAAPWLLFVTLLTQMAARYTILPAMMAAALVGVSVPASLLMPVLTVLACTMLGDALIARNPSIAPQTNAIISATFPDLGWAMLLLSGLMLVMACTPSPRTAELAAEGG